MHGIWQLARQTLVTDSRRVGSHAIRFGLVIVLYLAVIGVSWSRGRTAAGLPLFHAQLLITAFYLTMNAIFGFSQAIAEEKEEGTLGLLRLADISPLSIIIGKTLGRLIDAALLLAIQIPFTIVAITLGGISWDQVTAAYVALATYLWLLATLGLLASVLQPTGAAAARWTAVPIIFYVVPPYIGLLGASRWNGVNAAYRYVSLPIRLTDVTESSFGESPWCSAVIFGIVTSLCFLLWAWWSFDRAVHTTEPVKRAAKPIPARSFSRRAWSRPVIWREFLFLTGGIPWLTARVLGHVGILLIMFTVQDTIGHVFAWASIFSGLYALFDGTWLASRLFRDEIRDRTWSTLVQSPLTIPQLALDKLCGWALGMVPSILLPYWWILITILVHQSTTFDMAVELLIGSATVGLSVIAYLHLLVLMSLYYGWQATPLTVTVTCAAGWLYVWAVFESVRSVGLRCTLFVFTGLVLLGVMATLQVLIVRRLKVVSETA